MSSHVEVGPVMARRAVVLFIGKMSLLFLHLLFAILGPRLLGPRGMGFYSYFFAIVFTLFSLLDAGGSMVLRRYIPDLLTRAPGQVRPLFKGSLRAKGFVLVLFLAAIPLTPDPMMYGLALAAAFFSTLVDSVQAVHYTGGALISYAVIPSIWGVFRIALVLLLGSLFVRFGISVALLVSPLIMVVLFWPRALGLLPKSKERLHGSYWKFLRFGLVSYIGDLAFVLSNRVAIILSRPLLDDMAEIGFLGYAFMIYLMARQLAFVIGETSIPTLVRYHTSGDKAQFSRTMDHVWRYTNILVFAAALVIYKFVGPIITGIIDPAFQRSAMLTKLLVPALIATTLTLSLRIPLFVRERSFRLLFAHGGALLSFGLALGGFWFFKKGEFGAEHVAASFTISTFAGFLLMAYRAGTEVRLTRLYLATLKPALSAVGSFLVFREFVVHAEMGWLLVSIPGIVVVYAAFLFALRGLEIRDWDRLLALFGRKLRD